MLEEGQGETLEAMEEESLWQTALQKDALQPTQQAKPEADERTPNSRGVTRGDSVMIIMIWHAYTAVYHDGGGKAVEVHRKCDLPIDTVPSLV